MTLRAAIGRGFAALARLRWELLTAAAWLTGWLAITWGLATIPSRGSVWLLSLGLLAIGLGGVRLLWTIFVHGIYALSREDNR